MNTVVALFSVYLHLLLLLGGGSRERKRELQPGTRSGREAAAFQLVTPHPPTPSSQQREMLSRARSD